MTSQARTQATNHNKHIVRYLKKHKQSDNEIWSVDRI